MEQTETGGKLQWGRVMIYAGAILAFFIGAGFATGQEILMYFVAWGNELYVCAGIVFVILLWSSVTFAVIGARQKFSKNSDVYHYYCGKIVGTAYDYFSVVFCFACYVYMVAGAGSSLHQQFGLPSAVGAAVMGISVILTVSLGLDKITEVLGRLGTVILVMVLASSLWNLFLNVSNVIPNLQLIAENGGNQFGIQKSIAPNAVMNGMNYMGTVIIWFITFVSMMATNSPHKRELKHGMVFGSVMILVSVLVCCLAMISVIDQIGSSDAPNLIMASNIWKPLGTVFAVIVILGIYTSAVPLLWTPVSRFTADGSPKAKMLAVILGIAGVVIALFIPYKTLVNYIINLGGMLTYVLYIFILIKSMNLFFSHRADVKKRRKKKYVTAYEK